MTSIHPENEAGWAFAGVPLAHGLGRNWWLVLLRGVTALIFGVLALAWPGVTVLTLTVLFGAFAFADGVFCIGAAIAARQVDAARRWWLALVGALGVLAGIIVFAEPLLAAQILVVFIGAWAIMVGVLQVWGAIRLRREIRDEWFLVVTGVASFIFGVLLFAWPLAGALSLAWLVGWYAIIAGVALVALSFRLRKYKTVQ